MAKSNRKTMHFAHEISDILAVQRKQMWPRYETKSLQCNALRNWYESSQVTLTRFVECVGYIVNFRGVLPRKKILNADCEASQSN